MTYQKIKGKWIGIWQSNIVKRQEWMHFVFTIKDKIWTLFLNGKFKK